MKTKTLSALFFLLASPLALLATSTDNQIEDAAKASYNYRTVLEDHVKVKSKDGVVTLSGTVRDQDEKDLAQDTVENLPGVIAVHNEIKVKPDYPEKSDGWMAFKIRSRLLVKSHVSASSTKVQVTDGHVVLTGTADTQAQKDLTEAYAKDIDGVKSVENDIVVTNEPPKRDMGDKMDDASITSQVKYALLTHKGTSAIKTKVKTVDGIVIISGDASSDAEKTLVSKLAGDVRGVVSVTNNMTVRN